MDNSLSKIITLTCFGVVAIIFAHFIWKSVTPAPRAPVVPEETYKFIPTCGTVNGSCIATATIKQLSCNETQAEKELAELLKFPIQSEECKVAADNLNTACSFGCSLDTSSLQIISGRLDVIFAEIAEARGCIATGNRPVSISGTCRPDS